MFINKSEPASVEPGDFLVRYAATGVRAIVTTDVFNDEFAFIDDEGIPEVKPHLDPEIEKADKEIEEELVDDSGFDVLDLPADSDHE